MMKSTIRTILVLILLAGWVLAASAIYVVRLPEGFIGMVPKDRLSFVDTYVDVRGWTAADAAEHPDLVRRLAETKKIDWLSSVVGLPQAKGDSAVHDLLELVNNSTTQTSAHSAKAPIMPVRK